MRHESPRRYSCRRLRERGWSVPCSASARVMRMNASSSDARRGVSSCSVMPPAAASSPIRAASRPCTSSASWSVCAVAAPWAARTAASDPTCGDLTRTAPLEARAGEVLDRRVGDEPAPSDHDQAVRGQRHLAHQVRRDEDRPTLGRQASHQLANPADALGVEPVGGLVEDQRAGVAEQRRGDPEPLPHAQREASDALAGDLVRPTRSSSASTRRRPMPWVWASEQQVAVGGAAGVDRARPRACAPTSWSGAAKSR